MTFSLSEQQRIPTSGARAAKAFNVQGLDLLAIPQLAVDVAGKPAGMNDGDSDTEVLLYRLAGDRYEPFGSLIGPGGEDAEFFQIDGRSFLAIACIRTGSGPYDFDTDSLIYEWREGAFELFQKFPSFAAKQWKHWQVAGRHFLGLAQGLELPGAGHNRNSLVLEWDGASFVPFQTIPSHWSYNWYPFEIDGRLYVAHADHVGASVLYRWANDRLEPHQELIASGGRAFVHFERDGDVYLLAAAITEPPRLLRWDGTVFVSVQELAGTGARELTLIESAGRLLIIRVNFITGSPAAPEPSLWSQIYEWRDGALDVLTEFPTVGGTDSEILRVDGAVVTFAVSNGLSADVRFAGESVIYRLELLEAGAA
ncbi:EPTP domain-containing protein [Nocardioides sp. YR527]|uniref:hypothetical protein n=1 Tax=Nocardioides sp. YR527 TaxID=1881028 RepID=UPI00088AA572|nr:hypothetical protein [Nocardioides sp. YR527]SDK57043.1 EPTP domain-containing protein [Nocardioides sp. YR527]